MAQEVSMWLGWIPPRWWPRFYREDAMNVVALALVLAVVASAALFVYGVVGSAGATLDRCARACEAHAGAVPYVYNGACYCAHPAGGAP